MQLGIISSSEEVIDKEGTHMRWTKLPKNYCKCAVVLSASQVVFLLLFNPWKKTT
jgi:hypothetical protein